MLIPRAVKSSLRPISACRQYAFDAYLDRRQATSLYSPSRAHFRRKGHLTGLSRPGRAHLLKLDDARCNKVAYYERLLGIATVLHLRWSEKNTSQITIMVKMLYPRMHYDLNLFQELVKSDEWSYLNERRAFSTREKLGWTNEDVANVLCGLLPADFQKIVENCAVENFPGCDLLTADQYRIFWHETSKTRVSAFGPGVIELSLKISVFDDAGEAAGLVTFHISGGY